jgi:hypothetical protein
MGLGTAWGGYFTCNEDIRRIRFPQGPPFFYSLVEKFWFYIPEILSSIPSKTTIFIQVCAHEFEQVVGFLNPSTWPFLNRMIRE